MDANEQTCAQLDHPIEVPMTTRRRYVELACRCRAYVRLVDMHRPLKDYVLGWGPNKFLRVSITPR